MAQLLPNRLSEVMSDAQITQFHKGIQMALDALPKKPILSNDDYAKIPKKGKTRAKEADLLIRVVRKYQRFLPATLKMEEVEKDNRLYGQLSELSNHTVQDLFDHLEFLMGLSGGEELNAYSRFISNVRTAAQEADSEAIAALNEIEQIERLTGGGDPRKKATTKAKS
jgi:hypothetical protein